MPYLNDPVAEIVDIYAYEARRDRIASRAASISPSTASMISSYARNTPWIKPGVNLGLSQLGIGPNDPRVEQISKLALGSDPRFTTGANSFGDEVRADQLTPGKALGNFAAAKAMSLGQDLLTDSSEMDKTREQVRGEGWRSVDEILAEHPELQGAIASSQLVIKDGFVNRPRNVLTREGKAYDRLEQAFLQAGVNLPFVDDEQRLGIVQAQASTKSGAKRR